MIDVKTYRTDELNTYYERLINKKETLASERPLAASVLEKIVENLTIEWTYNSNSIEGNTLSLVETKLLLQDGITIGGKTLREHFETINHEKAINYLYSLVDDRNELRSIDILKVHELVLKNIEDDFAGRIRNAGVRIVGANFIPPNASKVSVLLDELVDFVNNNPLKLNDIELATAFHHRFVWIHPFFDGNGRTVRLIMNLLLLRKGFPPAIILKNDRKKYYDALNQANNGNYAKLHLLMLQATERSLNIYLNAMPGLDYEYEPIINIVSEPTIPFGQEYISLLARTGKIDAHKEGRNWYTSKKAIEKYMESIQKKIPKT